MKADITPSRARSASCRGRWPRPARRRRASRCTGARHITPAIIESSDARQIYCLTTNDREFYMFVKYRSTPTTNNETFTSWSFTFSDSDISELQKLLNSDKDLSLGLICGNTPQHTSQYAILHNHEISQIMSLGKKSLTIRSKKREHNFCIPISDGNGQDIRIAKKTAY